MSVLRRVLMWFVALFRPGRLERDLDREMRFHLEMEIEANVRRGMSPDEARRVALVAFGGIERHKESARDERGTRFIDGSLDDVRLAFRRFRSHRAFTLLTTATLAVGIGATTAVFSFANWVLYRPVPGVVAPDELVTVSFEEGPGQSTGISYAMLLAIRELPAFSGMAASASSSRFQIVAEDVSARIVGGAAVAGDYFGVLGVPVAAGRLLLPDELTATSGSRNVVLSEQLATSMFGSLRAAVGKRVRVNAVEFVVVGVATDGFRGTERVGSEDVWLPAASYADLRHIPSYDVADRRTRAFFNTIGRLRPGANSSVAQSQLRSTVAGLVAQFPKDYAIYTSRLPTVWPDVGTNVLGRAESHRTMRLMLGIAAVALLIACANIANLLLFQGVTRRAEMAVRRALGASAAQILRQHVAEGLSIGAVGALGGIAVALALRALFVGQRVISWTEVDHIGMDARVLWFVGTVALATALVFGVVPAVAALGDDQFRGLREAGRRSSEGRSLARSALAVGQVAASVSLIVGALLFARTLVELRRVELGFDPSNVYAFSLDPDAQGMNDAGRVRSLRDQVALRLRAVSGIDAVTYAFTVQFLGGGFRSDFRLPSSSGPDWMLEADVLWVDADYFRAVRIPLLAGRDFTRSELADAQRSRTVPVVLSQSAARRLFGDRNPLGETIHERAFEGPVTRFVVGVIGDTRDGNLRAAPDPIIYQPIGAAYRPAMTLVVRSSRPRRDVQTLVEEATAAVVPTLAVPPAVALQELVDRAMASERVFLRLVGLLATIAAVLAGVGLYALLAFTVAARTREIGIRMALGAQTASVVRVVARQGARLLVIGLMIGVAVAAAATKVLESRLFGVSRLDPLTYAVAVLTLVATGVVAFALPARQAAKTDPVLALRTDH